MVGLSISRTPITLPSEWIGITISELLAPSQAMCPGNPPLTRGHLAASAGIQLQGASCSRERPHSPCVLGLQPFSASSLFCCQNPGPAVMGSQSLPKSCFACPSEPGPVLPLCSEHLPSLPLFSLSLLYSEHGTCRGTRDLGYTYCSLCTCTSLLWALNPLLV